jgi:hypothetical protein
MLPLSKKLDELLLNLAWSLWTELGVRGIKCNHSKCLITPEELIILTTALADIDPRLRDESLDWCSKYHHLISISRLKSIAKNFGSSLNEPFSTYCATLNLSAGTSWPLLQDASPLKITLSHKSRLLLESPASLNIRARSLFGIGARADLITFFLTHIKSNFAASDVVEIGYSKRNLAQILEEFCLGKLFEKFLVRNQQRYRLIKSNSLIKILSPIPDYAPSWRIIFELLLSLRDCIHRIEKNSESTQVIEIRNFFKTFQQHLHRLNLTPPPWYADFSVYLHACNEWLLEAVSHLTQGEFPNNSFLTTYS